MTTDPYHRTSQAHGLHQNKIKRNPYLFPPLLVVYLKDKDEGTMRYHSVLE